MQIKLLFTFSIFFLAIFLASAQWSDDASENTAVTGLETDQIISKIAVGDDGHTYIGYFSLENSNYAVRLQRLDPQGNMLWEENGLLISDHPTMSWVTDWDMTIDHDNHAILTWQDMRTGHTNITGYRISPDGDFTWGEDGIQLSNTSGFDASPKVTVTQDNHAVFAWQSGTVIIMQRVNSEGEKQWGDWGIVFSGDADYTWPQIMPAGESDIVMKYYHDIGPAHAPTRDLHLQRFDSDGQPVWEEATVVFDDGSITAWTQIIAMIDDGDDGVILAWHDNSISGTISSARVQHITQNGETQFEDNGVLVSLRHDFNQFNPAVTRLNDGGIYVVWSEVTSDQNAKGIYAQHISEEGEREWGDNGKILMDISATNQYPFSLKVAEEQLMMFYQVGVSGMHFHIRAARLDKNGDFVWDDIYVDISNAPGGKSDIALSELHNNQWILAWNETRHAGSDIFAQNFTIHGALGAQEDTYTLTLLTQGEGTIDADGIPYTAPIETEAGVEIFLEAFPEDGYILEAWLDEEGEVISEEESFIFTMPAENTTLTAKFAEAPAATYLLTLLAEPAGAGVVAGGGTYTEGQEVTLTATAEEGYVFVNWKDDDSQQVSSEATFDYTMPAADITLTAHFDLESNISMAHVTQPAIFPNPARSHFFIHSNDHIRKVTLSDITGSSVQQIVTGGREVKIETGHLTTGIFIVLIHTDNGVVVKKIQLIN